MESLRQPKKVKRKREATNEAEEDKLKSAEVKSDQGEEEPAAKQKKSKGCGVLTDVPFSSLALSEPTLKAIHDKGFKTMTKIQCDAIPPLLSGKDLLGAARTDSGKTLAFLIPDAELLHKLSSSSRRETSVIVICPTRELEIQLLE